MIVPMASLELDRALHDTIVYLRSFMPLDEISIQAYERDLGVFRQLTRVNAEGVTFKGDPVVVPVQQEIRELIEELAGLLAAAVATQAVLRFDLAEDVPLIEADTTQIRQILMNLVTNAEHAVEALLGGTDGLALLGSLVDALELR